MLRKRFIPDEVVDISKDKIIFMDDEMIVTKWIPIKPRKDFDSGLSFTLLKEGIKLSRFEKSGEHLYWYCDIINIEFDSTLNTYTFSDLLADVKIMPDGKVIVLDIEEIAEALNNNLIDQNLACEALTKLGSLLDKIYKGEFPSEKYLTYKV